LPSAQTEREESLSSPKTDDSKQLRKRQIAQRSKELRDKYGTRFNEAYLLAPSHLRDFVLLDYIEQQIEPRIGVAV
jgi:hypothetical protein